MRPTTTPNDPNNFVRTERRMLNLSVLSVLVAGQVHGVAHR